MSSITIQQVESMLSGTNIFFKNLIGMNYGEEVDQAVHQAQYVQNLIGDEVGWKYKLKFDVHSQTLYKELVDKSKQEVVESFYRYFIPSKLVESVAREVNQILSTQDLNAGNNGNLYRLFTYNLFNDDDLENSWRLDDKGKPTLTEFGAIKLLEKIGALK